MEGGGESVRWRREGIGGGSGRRRRECKVEGERRRREGIGGGREEAKEEEE